jgi:hypothetical protein
MRISKQARERAHDLWNLPHISSCCTRRDSHPRFIQDLSMIGREKQPAEKEKEMSKCSAGKNDRRSIDRVRKEKT